MPEHEYDTVEAGLVANADRPNASVSCGRSDFLEYVKYSHLWVRVLRISPVVLLHLFRVEQHFKCVANPIPGDARIIAVGYDPSLAVCKDIRLVLWSRTFSPVSESDYRAGNLPELARPEYRQLECSRPGGAVDG